jgi:hypothetical protein
MKSHHGLESMVDIFSAVSCVKKHEDKKYNSMLFLIATFFRFYPWCRDIAPLKSDPEDKNSTAGGG